MTSIVDYKIPAFIAILDEKPDVVWLDAATFQMLHGGVDDLMVDALGWPEKLGEQGGGASIIIKE